MPNWLNPASVDNNSNSSSLHFPTMSYQAEVLKQIRIKELEEALNTPEGLYSLSKLIRIAKVNAPHLLEDGLYEDWED